MQYLCSILIFLITFYLRHSENVFILWKAIRKTFIGYTVAWCLVEKPMKNGDLLSLTSRNFISMSVYLLEGAGQVARTPPVSRSKPLSCLAARSLGWVSATCWPSLGWGCAIPWDLSNSFRGSIPPGQHPPESRKRKKEPLGKQLPQEKLGIWLIWLSLRGGGWRRAWEGRLPQGL